MPEDYSDWEVTGSPQAQFNPSDWEVSAFPQQQSIGDKVSSGIGSAFGTVSPFTGVGGDLGTILGGLLKNNPLVNPARNVSAGIVSGLGRGGQGIANALTGGNAPTVDWDAIQNAIGQQNPGFVANTEKGIGSTVPYIEAGGPLGEMAGSGIGRLSSAGEGALSKLQNIGSNIGMGVGAGTANALQSPNHPLVSFIANALPVGYFAGKLAQPVKEFAENFIDPEKLASDIHSNFFGGHTKQSSGKALAQELKANYDNIKGQHSADYESIFNSPTEEESYITGEPFKANELSLTGKDYDNNYSDYEFPDKNLQSLHEKFMQDKSLENAHRLQSELGSEIGYLKNQKNKDMLDSSGKNLLNDYSNMRTTILDDMNSRLKEASPDLADRYEQATENWSNNVIPYHSDKTLRDIVNGKVKNPTAGQVRSIFSYPEESINKVSGDLSQNGRDNITRVGMNLTPYQSAPKDIINGHNSLYKNGLESYVSPELDQNIANLRSNVSATKLRQAEAKNQPAAKPSTFGSLAKYGAVALPTYAVTNALSNMFGINPETLTNAILETNAMFSGNKNPMATGNK